MSEWSVGTMVAFVPGGYGKQPYIPCKIEKVYANGNVVAMGVRFRVRGDFAHQTGNTYGGATLKQWTPEVAKKASADALLSRWRKALGTLKDAGLKADEIPLDLLDQIESYIRKTLTD